MAAPKEYNIWLANPYKMWFQRDSVINEVAQLFKPVIQKSGKYSSVRVRSTMSEPSLASHELLVYLVPNYDFSVVKGVFGVDVAEAAGRTIADRGASEVYIAGETVSGNSGVPLRIDWLTKDPPVMHFASRFEPEEIAQIVFHEAMHNKGKLGEKQLHNHSGPKEALFRSTLTPQSRLTKEDVALMAKHLDSKVPQWTGGWSQLGK
jgi:hypothetical protein